MASKKASANKRLRKNNKIQAITRGTTKTLFTKTQSHKLRNWELKTTPPPQNELP